MFRIDGAGAVLALPEPATAGTQGYFSNGDLASGKQPTLITADFLNMVQEELMTVILAAGLSPSKTDHGQLLEALRNQFTPTTTLFGIGQIYEDVTTARALGTPFTNGTDRPIFVSVNVDYPAAGSNTWELTIGGVVVGRNSGNSTYNNTGTLVGVVPPGAQYAATTTSGTVTLHTWSEMRHDA